MQSLTMPLSCVSLVKLLDFSELVFFNYKSEVKILIRQVKIR